MPAQRGEMENFLSDAEPFTANGVVHYGFL